MRGPHLRGLARTKLEKQDLFVLGLDCHAAGELQLIPASYRITQEPIERSLKDARFNLVQSGSVSELREQWEGLRNEVSHIGTREKAASRSPAVPSGIKSGSKTAQLTATLVAWVSSQSEAIVEEMEAIAKHNAETDDFSVVHYLRYLKLYDQLKVIARQQIDELKWVGKKAKVFSKIYQLALDMVAAYLQDLNSQLTKLELDEPKSKQLGVTPEWLRLYESIRYVATHAPIGSKVAEEAKEMLTFSPNGTMDKMRTIRYELKTHVTSR